jgi:hypothetical protein
VDFRDSFNQVRWSRINNGNMILSDYFSEIYHIVDDATGLQSLKREITEITEIAAEIAVDFLYE